MLYPGALQKIRRDADREFARLKALDDRDRRADVAAGMERRLREDRERKRQAKLRAASEKRQRKLDAASRKRLLKEVRFRSCCSGHSVACFVSFLFCLRLRFACLLARSLARSPAACGMPWPLLADVAWPRSCFVCLCWCRPSTATQMKKIKAVKQQQERWEREKARKARAAEKKKALARKKRQEREAKEAKIAMREKMKARARAMEAQKHKKSKRSLYY